MALLLTKELPTGETAEYWVAEPHANKRDDKTSIIMLLWKDAAAREAGKECILRQTFQAPMDGCYHTGAEIYAHVKTPILVTRNEGEEIIEENVNPFSSAEDC